MILINVLGRIEMNDILKQYKSTVTLIGVGLIIFSLLINTLFSAYYIIDELLYTIASDQVYEVVVSILYDIAYLLSFMVPAVIIRLFLRKKNQQPVRFEVKLSWKIFAMIFACVFCCFAFSFLNSMIVSLFDSPYEDMFNYYLPPMSDVGIILQFITIAFVPAFCEEFLFRGVVLSNLMPYGKSAAIIISSICFGLMHGNFYQFLYTTVAGIFLGLIYAETGSIWPSTIAHMINNAISVLQTVMYERMEENYATLFSLLMDSLIFFVGIISIIYLVKKLKSRKKSLNVVYGMPINADYTEESAPICTDNNIPAKEAFKLFMCFPIVIFAVYNILQAALALLIM